MSFPVFDIPAKRADLDPHRVAMEDLVSGECVTYRDLDERTGRSAALLAELGAGAGDRIAILCRNRIEFFELLFACARLGAILVPLNWRMPATELAPLITDCGAKWLIHGVEDTETVRGLSNESLVLLNLDDDSADGYRARRDSSEALAGRAASPSDETWYLLYTSGTTGMPKAVIQTYGMAIANYINISQAMGLRGDDTSLNFLPLFHTGGINITTLPGLIMGARALVMPGFDLEPMIELVEAGRLDTFFGVPAIYQAISLHERFDELDLSRVRCWACGGAPLPDNLSNSTVRTLLRILVEKGHLKQKLDGQRYVYRPKRARPKAARGELKRIVETFFDGSVEQALVGLLRSADVELNEDELNRLGKMIEKARKEGR